MALATFTTWVYINTFYSIFLLTKPVTAKLDGGITAVADSVEGQEFQTWTEPVPN